MDMLRSMEGSAIEPAEIKTIAPQEFTSETWPVQPGDYRVFDPRAPVAVLFPGETRVLEDTELRSIGGVSVAGSVRTENIGIEHVLKNIVSNPHIRHLALVGRDVKGHRPGDAIVNLYENGLDSSRRIVGAAGARPVLRNTLPQEISHFRKQITLHDLTESDARGALREIERLRDLPSEPFEHGLFVRLVDVIRAEPAKRLRLDPQGYFVILIRRGSENPIYVEHYRNDGRLAHAVEGKDAATLCSTITSMGLVSQLDHAAYLGRELAMAERSASNGFAYVQDRAQGEPVDAHRSSSPIPCSSSVALCTS